MNLASFKPRPFLRTVNRVLLPIVLEHDQSPEWQQRGWIPFTACEWHDARGISDYHAPHYARDDKH